jgi:hypothetical protein
LSYEDKGEDIMPCICYGAITGKEQFDEHLKSDEGKATLLALEEVSNRIKKVRIHQECMSHEWHAIWVEALMHYLCGCPEKKDK